MKLLHKSPAIAVAAAQSPASMARPSMGATTAQAVSEQAMPAQVFERPSRGLPSGKIRPLSSGRKWRPPANHFNSRGEVLAVPISASALSMIATLMACVPLR